MGNTAENMFEGARMDRKRVSSGGPFEKRGGYCRAIKAGDMIFVAGTAAFRDGKLVGPNDPRVQTRVILETISAALAEFGASLDDAVRYRVFVTDISRWEEVLDELGAAFRVSRPAGTMVEMSGIIDPEAVVEIEVDAYVGK
jgi:enamine deaminase RidA (YjgF/YER057c/UK114 family)